MTASRPGASLPHTGVATFCKSPYVFEVSELEADIAVLGVPFDGMASMRPGCRQAPRALRDASSRFGWLGDPRGTKGFFEVATGKTLLSGKRIVDVGDVDVSLEEEVTRERIKQHALRIVERGALLVSIGGDHSISFPLISAFERYAPLTVVLLDAHLDYRDTFLGLKYSNNSPFRRAKELPFVKRIVTLGVRGIKSTDAEYRQTLADGNVVISADALHEGEFEILISKLGELGNVYLSLDIDALDPSIAPGTESPEADGLSFRQAKRILRAVGQRGKVVGIDLVEVNPYLDHAELTQHIAIQLLIEAVASAAP